MDAKGLRLRGCHCWPECGYEDAINRVAVAIVNVHACLEHVLLG